MSNFEPQKTDKKATVIVNIEVMVEVQETDGYFDMEEQAKEQIRKRVLEVKGFYPFRMHCETIHNDVTVDELKGHTIVHPGRRWR